MLDFVASICSRYDGSNFSPCLDLAHFINALRVGYGAFETIRIENNLPYLYDKHINRLISGLLNLGCVIQGLDHHLQSNIVQLLSANQVKESLIRVTVCIDIDLHYVNLEFEQGVSDSSFATVGERFGAVNSSFQRALACNKAFVLIELLPKRHIPSRPVDLFVSSYTKPPSQSIPSNFKTLNRMNSVLSKIEALEQCCFESIRINEYGTVCDVSSGNIFWVKNPVAFQLEGDTQAGKIPILQSKQVYTPSVSCGALPGITRGRIIDLLDCEVIEGDFEPEDLIDSESVFITNSSWIALPVKSIKLNNKVYTFKSEDMANMVSSLIKLDALSIG